MFNIEFVKSAGKEYLALPKIVQSRIEKGIEALRFIPHPVGSKKLQGHTRLFRVRVGDYRVVYSLDETAQLITVTRIRHRKDVYQ